MKRLRVFFAVLLLLLALPLWRFIDLQAIFSPFQWTLSVSLTAWFGLFILIPLRLIFRKIKFIVLITLLLGYGISAWWGHSVSSTDSMVPELNHCGDLTYTGTFYPIRNWLSDAHHDDLDVRNQMCWLRKMIEEMPSRFDQINDFNQYSTLTRERLLKPQHKFAASLPLVALLHFNLIGRYKSQNQGPIEIDIPQSILFWQEHYGDFISDRNYSWINYPHSEWIKFEYGLIEKNWDYLIRKI